MPRPKKPREVKIFEGTHRADRDAKNPMLPQPVEYMPPLPYGVELGDHGLQLWGEMVMKLRVCRVLTDTDLQALAVLCRATEQYWSVSKLVAERGEVITVNGVPKVNPALRAQSMLYQQLTSGWSHFGLTPADRQKIEALPGEQESGGDEWGIV